MPLVPIDDISTIGVIEDLPSHSLPPGAWSRSNNVRFRDGKAEKTLGWANVMGTPSGAPAFVMNVDNAGDSFWIYAEADGAASGVYAFNSGSHADISQAGGYSVSDARAWNGTVFQGIPILNYGGGDPQYWSSLNLATDLQDLSNWPSNTTAEVIRTFKNFLVALNITDGGGNHIHRVLWSDGAAPGTLPSSWDVTDKTVEANHRDLSDVNSGEIVGGLALSDYFVIYKLESTWLMRYIGGTLIMGTNQLQQKSGLLCARAVTAVTLPNQKKEVHFAHNGIDLGTFDGKGFESVVDKKVRQKLLSDIDPIYFRNSYVFDNPTEYEAFFAYPQNGSSTPDKCLVWNYKENNVGFRDFFGVHAATGVVEGASAETWSTVSGSWTSQDPAKWQEASRRKVVIADEANTKLQQLDAAEDHDGTSFSTRLLRRGLTIAGVSDRGQIIQDIRARKLLTRVWIMGVNAPINVRVGGEDMPGSNDNEANIEWLDSQEFDPSAQQYLDFVINTRFLAIEFSSTADAIWQLSSIAYEIEVISEL